jgi:hypothetical protein
MGIEQSASMKPYAGTPTSILIIRTLLLFPVICYIFVQQGFSETLPLIPSSATWNYLDNGSNQGTAWRSPGFNDSRWASGSAQLGYGDADETTVVSYGADPDNKFITTYFRHTFQVANLSGFTNLILNLIRDDGAVVYLNGTEVWRTNMPAGAITYTTPALTAISGSNESTFLQTTIRPSLLVQGTNVVAVEIHQSEAASSDISFDLKLIATDGLTTPVLTRGPYLQMGTPSSIVVRWRTDMPTDSRVLYGTSQDNLNAKRDNATLTTEHEVTLTGLISNTTYYYAIGTTSVTLAGNDAYHFFTTSPVSGTASPARIWVLGDSGTANANAQAVRDAYLNFTGAKPTNLWMMLGDNAYNDGTDSEYQAAVFNMYPQMLRKSVLWPTLGNHDTAQSSNPPAELPYFSIFTLPTRGEAGGLASGIEDYYSFDYGNIHFICLDSMTSDRSTGSPMMTWVQNDLAATTQQWIIAFWHHPPYSKGSHDSDAELQLVEMRQNALPILEAGGVDLVLTGHSHSYERSFLIDGHYGLSGTFTNAMKKNAGDGRDTGNGAYIKGNPRIAANDGAVYAVAGSSGQISGGQLNHPAMFISLNSLGSMVLDIEGNRLDAKFLTSGGVVADSFTLIKAVALPAAPSALVATAVNASQIHLAWADNSTNENGFKIEQSTNGTTFTEIASVGANSQTYQSTGLNAGIIYYYRVRAFNSAGESAYSATATATILDPVLSAPTLVAATTLSASKIKLTWLDNSNNETGFTIESCTGASCTNFAEIAQVGADLTAFTVKGLSRKTEYRFRLKAFNAAGNSAYTMILNARTFKR